MSKRILVIVLTVCLAVVGMTVMAFADETYGDFTYTVTDNEATITKYNGSATVVEIPSTIGGYTVTTIGNRAFYYKTSMTSVTIPDSVETIDTDAFYYCTNLETVTLGSSVETIGESAFSCCESLTSITIPDSVEAIGRNAFYYCTKLETVTLGSGAETIGESAFSYCKSLSSITIPDSVKTISESAFSNCSKLVTISFGISSQLSTIGEAAFADCESLASITIPNGVTSIGKYAFNNTALTSITIPNSVETIEDYCFAYCTSLTSITIPSGVTSVGGMAFYLGYGVSNIITDVYYAGTSDEWNQISFGIRNDNLTSAFIHYNCTSIHTYTLEPDFTWSSDYSTCTVALACSVCGAVKEESLSCAVTDDITPAVSCAEDGVAIYTATCTYDGIDYEDVQTVILTIPHTLTHTEAKSATCTEDGNIEYWHCSTCDQYFSDEDCTMGILLTDTVIAASHSYYVSSCTWYDNYTSATLKLVCDSCGDVVEIDATEITSEEDGSGIVVYKATVRYGNINYSQITTVEAEEKSSSKSDIYTTLSRIQASYTGVQAAIEKANALNPDDYENFSAVTEAIEAVDWSLNVLNQKLVNSYAEAIEEAIENLVPVETVDITEETIEVVDPVEAGETDSE